MLQKWDKVSELLGVKMGREFRILGSTPSREDFVYRITKNGLEYRGVNDKGVWLDLPDFPLLDCVRRGWKCEELPWKPKVGERFWYPNQFGFRGKVTTYNGVWTGSIANCALYECDLVYRTEEECRENMKRDYERITGEKWQWQEGQA